MDQMMREEQELDDMLLTEENTEQKIKRKSGRVAT